jgi:TPR repeat protein
VAHQNKIVDLPASRERRRMESAIQAYMEGDYTGALSQFKNLINEGCNEAYSYVGNIYESGGQGVEADIDKAIFYYQKSIEECGDVEAYLGLGRIYFYGKGSNAEYQKAFEYYSLVAQESGRPIAYLMLGRMYHSGKGVDRNLSKAKECYEIASAKGNVFAIKNLGLLEIETGHYLRGMFLRAKAVLKGFFVALKDTQDSKLRSN